MTERLNLMHLVWALDAAGMENGVINLSHRLPRDQFASSICTFQSGGSAEARVDQTRVKLVHRKRHSSYDPSLPLRLASLLRREQVDILHTHNWVTFREGLVAAKLAGVPVVVHGEHGKVRERPRQIFVQRWGWRHVDCVLAVSEALADRMADRIGFPRERIQVISNGVDLDRFHPPTRAKQETRRQLGLPAEGLMLGMVARFVPFKDHAGVLRAVAQLRADDVELHLALAGDGPLRDELAELAGRLAISDRVHFLGELAAVETLLHGLDVLVSNSSCNEGMSNAILEAMACGVPVIATRVAASPELLDDGQVGPLVSPANVEELVAAIRQLAGDTELRETLSQQVRRRVERHYSIPAMVDSYRSLYLELSAAVDGATPDRLVGTNICSQ